MLLLPRTQHAQSSQIHRSAQVWDEVIGLEGVRERGFCLSPRPTIPVSVSLERTTLCRGCSLVGTHRNCWELARSRWEMTNPCPRARARGAQLGREPEPGLCLHPHQLWSHHACLCPAQLLLEQPLALLRLMHAAQQHKARQHARCTSSMRESRETASAEVFFLLEKPPPCLLQPQAGATAWSCGTASFTHGLQLEPSLGWTAAVPINPGVRKARKQFKSQHKTKKIAHPLPRPTARRNQPLAGEQSPQPPHPCQTLQG